MSPRSPFWLALALASLGNLLLAQEAPVRPEAPPAAIESDTAPVTSRDPFRSQLFGPPAPQTTQRTRTVQLLGTLHARGRIPRALLQVSAGVFVVKPGDRVPLNTGTDGEQVEYLEVLAVEDGYLALKSGRREWILR